ncbi:hydroxycarboxylic acid receptor 2-like [Onychostoma macrolepis]|uniref:hydroxycarboxylic acid receptor 2-like n=1 Tax=Onychostoma macrolepis TaxID=369639 RepID=UPI00272C1628|nr:hydroxycarboxylic acid receptor 2-like [Onychostoma macrolepis]XP_058613289.1 hydroxycarboxylic acid receptor 2-like [Onychostoma macrolepis]XP_058613290.1 hydroxycarboxylic acid receptor 2-like [Onychostoma macrolepis]
MLIHSLHINTSPFIYTAFVTFSAILETEEMNSTEASTNSTTFEHLLWSLSIVDMFVCSSNFLFGFPVHSYIIWLIVTGKGSDVASESFNINLFICELWISFSCLLSVLSNFVQLMALPSFLTGLMVAGRPLFQCLICVERYLAVVHPVSFLKFKPLRYRVICCTVVWIITLASCLCCMFTSSLNQFIWFMWLFPIQFFLFLSIQLFCLVAVLRALKQSGPGERGRERREENHMKRRVFYLILIITVCMCISFVPYILAGVFNIFQKHNANTYNTFASVCFIMGGFVHPVLFLHRSGKLPCVCSS